MRKVVIDQLTEILLLMRLWNAIPVQQFLTSGVLPEDSLGNLNLSFDRNVSILDQGCLRKARSRMTADALKREIGQVLLLKLQ
ncbi:hypothetical protein D9M68_881770 [compost metagenome]